MQRPSSGTIAKVVTTAVSALAIVAAMGGSWSVAPALATPTITATPIVTPAPTATSPPPTATSPPPTATSPPVPGRKPGAAQLAGKLNLNVATAEQLMLLPTVGPSKAERIITWRKKNGGFKRIADLRRVKGFGYKTYKRLEPFLDVTGDTSLAKR